MLENQKFFLLLFTVVPVYIVLSFLSPSYRYGVIIFNILRKLRNFLEKKFNFTIVLNGYKHGSRSSSPGSESGSRKIMLIRPHLVQDPKHCMEVYEEIQYQFFLNWKPLPNFCQKSIVLNPDPDTVNLDPYNCHEKFSLLVDILTLRKRQFSYLRYFA
jgi:hypothetical protein